MSNPNFLIVGAAKAGTTSLYKYLQQHPQVFMSPLKEPHFFTYANSHTTPTGPGDNYFFESVVNSYDKYRELFDGASKELAIGEASPSYLYSVHAANQIKEYLPKGKIIAVLRNPVDRAYSAFLHMRRAGREPLKDFAVALNHEPERIQNGWGLIWHYRKAGYYYEQVERYYKLFGKAQVKVCLYEDLLKNPQEFLNDIFKFLEIDSQFTVNTNLKFNVGGVPKNQYLHNILESPSSIKKVFRGLIPEQVRKGVMHSLIASNLSKPSPIPEKLREEMVNEYREDLLKLQELISGDLTKWIDT